MKTAHRSRSFIVAQSLVYALAYAGMAVSITASVFAQSNQDEQRLASGEVIISVSPDPQASVAQIDATIDVAATPSKVWNVMLDCKRAEKFVRGLERCRILARDPSGAWDVREHVVSWIALFPQIRSVFRSDYILERKITFRRTEGDIDVLEGTWQLEPIRAGAATRLRYRARVGKDTIVPSVMIRAAIESDVPKTLRRLRDEIISGRS